MELDHRKFDESAVELVAKAIAEALSQSGLSSVEMAYALAAVLRGLGEATYDRPNKDSASVLQDYRTSPSWPAALILHADQIPTIWEMFLQERKDPEVNAKVWKTFEEKLNGRNQSDT